MEEKEQNRASNGICHEGHKGRELKKIVRHSEPDLFAIKLGTLT